MTLKRKWQLGDIVKAKHEMLLLPPNTTAIHLGVIIPEGTFLEILERYAFLGNVSNILVGKLIKGETYAYMVQPNAVVPLTRKENEIARLLTLKFKTGDWVMFREGDAWCVCKIKRAEKIRGDYKVQWIYDSIGIRQPNTLMSIDESDETGHKMTDMEIKLFKVLYG